MIQTAVSFHERQLLHLGWHSKCRRSNTNVWSGLLRRLPPVDQRFLHISTDAIPNGCLTGAATGTPLFALHLQNHNAQICTCSCLVVCVVIGARLLQSSPYPRRRIPVVSIFAPTIVYRPNCRTWHMPFNIGCDSNINRNGSQAKRPRDQQKEIQTYQFTTFAVPGFSLTITRMITFAADYPCAESTHGRGME